MDARLTLQDPLPPGRQLRISILGLRRVEAHEIILGTLENPTRLDRGEHDNKEGYILKDIRRLRRGRLLLKHTMQVTRRGVANPIRSIFKFSRIPTRRCTVQCLLTYVIKASRQCYLSGRWLAKTSILTTLQAGRHPRREPIYRLGENHPAATGNWCKLFDLSAVAAPHHSWCLLAIRIRARAGFAPISPLRFEW